MKKYLLLLSVIFITITLFAQNDSLEAPYKRFPIFPPVKLLLPDSLSFFTKSDLDKKKAVMLMLFNPQCEHCKHETEELIKNIDKFKNIQVVMATSMAFDSMLTFRERYQLSQYKNILVAQDTHFFLFSFFQNHNLPFLAFYNRKKELISVFEGGLPIERVLKEFEK
jgi:thiol-disulfide isomerase/thioredoxin